MKKSKNLHLTVSAILITAVSLIYGLFPDTVIPGIVDFKAGSGELNQVFGATMGLYAGMAVLWVSGIFNPVLWRTATIANVFFMFGLAAGRIFSLLTHGIPSFPFAAGLALELLLGLWGLVNLKKEKAN